MTPNPSMADVARLAGVSAQTVSRTLSGHPYVTDDTRNRVLEAVRETGYTRVDAAKNESVDIPVIGLINCPTRTLEEYLLAEAIRSSAAEKQYLLLELTPMTSGSDALEGAISTLVDRGVKGVILRVPVENRDEIVAAFGSTPAVFVGDGLGSVVRTLETNLDMVGRLCTEYLLNLGHQTVWHVSGAASSQSARATMQGWKQALEKAGREVPPVLTGDWTARSGYESGRVLARISEATAVYVASDEMALGLMRALQENGRRIPEDISVLGTGDIPLANYSMPPLTSWSHSFSKIGAQAVDLIINHGKVRSNNQLAAASLGQLVLRGSAQPPID